MEMVFISQKSMQLECVSLSDQSITYDVACGDWNRINHSQMHINFDSYCLSTH